MNKRRIAVLGSTGSIGSQTLNVIKTHKDFFTLEAITANFNADLLISQAREFIPNAVVISDESRYSYVKTALEDLPIKVFAGFDSVVQITSLESIDIVLSALVGYAGLLPSIRALEEGKMLALANKEALVVAGELVIDTANKHKVSVIPVDSEHSAIFQCLVGETNNPIEKIYLTASGGPFRDYTREQLKNVTPEQALKHPNWRMGDKVTIDSADLMNKGLEVIEAHWLFGLDPDKIDVLIHPQSIVHSMVQFYDGSIKAQLGLPDMKLPIQYALSYPYRLSPTYPVLDFNNFVSLTFEKPDKENFRNLELAYIAIKKGGNMPCILNAANEIVVEAFLKNKIPFLNMPNVIEKCMNKIDFISNPTYEDYVTTDKETRILAKSLL